MTKGSYENKTFTCPVCGHYQTERVRYWGESDGDDNKGVLSPDECPKCEGYKEASPKMYELIMKHYTTAESIREDLNTKWKKSIKDNYIHNWRLGLDAFGLCDSSGKDAAYDFFKSKYLHYKQISGKCEGFNQSAKEWATKESIKDLIHEYNKRLQEK